ncbi:MAG TPA: class I SAM-dependent methyltransferase [Acetobacteraceae bacterium]|nr:class I SAM-dependent methyltransferase [Acetobacteraceae bacterium]
MGEQGEIATGPNAAQFDYWNQVAGPKWVRLAETMDTRLAPVLARLLERAGAQPGECLLDVGCGAGTSTLRLAGQVGPSGHVLGVDISEPMLTLARRRAAERGISNISFLRADAQTHPFGAAAFDRVVSRFGVMFFADPVAAFRNLRRALRPGGALCFACWAPLAENLHWRIPFEIVVQALGPPAPKPPHAPGPMAFSDIAYLRSILESAGFAEPRIVAENIAIAGGSPDEEAALACLMGPSSALLEERAAPETLRAALRREIAAALLPFAAQTDGEPKVLLPASVYLVGADRSKD